MTRYPSPSSGVKLRIIYADLLPQVLGYKDWGYMFPLRFGGQTPWTPLDFIDAFRGFPCGSPPGWGGHVHGLVCLVRLGVGTYPLSHLFAGVTSLPCRLPPSVHLHASPPHRCPFARWLLRSFRVAGACVPREELAHPWGPCLVFG